MRKLIIVNCKNPNCSNTFKLHKSIIGRKLYCSSKCGTEHHWTITPLFEKKCINPVCNIIIKRKFKTILNRVHYCSPVCKRNHKNWIFQESLKDSIKSNCRKCNKEIIVNRQSCGKLIPRKICDNCDKQEKQQRVIKATEQFKFLIKNDINFKEKMKLVYLDNSAKIKSWRKNPDNLRKWYLGCQKAFEGGQSKLENKVFEYLCQKLPNIKIHRHEPISNILVDFYIPDKKLVIECQGDYWHMSPIKYSSNDWNQSTKKTAEEQWEKDRRRRVFIESNGYKVVEIWESEINSGDYKKLDIYI